MQFGEGRLDFGQRLGDQLPKQRTDIDAEGRRQVASRTIKHRFTGFSALDGSDGHTKLAVQAGFGEGFLAQAVLFAQRFEQTTVEQDPTIGKRRLSAGHGGKRKISGIHVDSPDRPVTLG